MGEVVKVITECLSADRCGDFVRCIDCGRLMLMQFGGAACICGSEKLTWADDYIHEASVGDLKTAGYIIEEDRRRAYV